MANSRVPVVQVKGKPRGSALPLARLLDIEEVADHLGVSPAVSVVAGVCLGRVRVEALLVGETAVVDAVVPIPGGHFQGEAYS